MRNGYLVVLSEREAVLEPYGESKKVIMSRQKLAELLTNPCYHIMTANNVLVDEYQMNHDEKLEEWGF